MNMTTDSLGDRMKKFENAFRQHLPGRLPIIIRVDGKAFHTLTHGMDKPVDVKFNTAMEQVARGLCREVQGAQLAYIQSDEISVLVHGYKRLNSQPWFDGNLNKIVSISAAVATRNFNAALDTGALFDSRAFVLPEAEVCNYFIWRQNDAVRNSIQSFAQSIFSHKELLNKSCNEMQEMMLQKGLNWDELPIQFKRGRCVVSGMVDYIDVDMGTQTQRRAWRLDLQIPFFKDNRNYIERYLACDE